MNGTSNHESVLPVSTGERELKPAPRFNINGSDDARLQKVKELLDRCHVTVAPLRNPQLVLHSHLPHIIGSAYGLGANNKLMTACYENCVKSLIEIDETFLRGDKIAVDGWRDFLQQKSYTVAYVDFFDEQMKQADDDWDGIANNFLYSGSESVINGMIGGRRSLGHPFIPLAYAYEFRSPSVLSEALSLACTEYAQRHSLLDHEPPNKSSYKTRNLAEVVQKLQSDSRLDGLVEFPGTVNFGLVLGPCPDVFLEHWNAWEVDKDNLLSSFENTCDTAALLAAATSYPEGKYDFFYAHMLTVAHALRVLWYDFPEDRRRSILRQFAMFVILIYILQFRRPFNRWDIDAVDCGGKDWNWVREKALNHRWALDEHFFKVVRAFQEMDRAWGAKNGFYLKAAILFVTEFNGWEGFGQGIMGFCRAGTDIYLHDSLHKSERCTEQVSHPFSCQLEWWASVKYRCVVLSRTRC